MKETVITFRCSPTLQVIMYAKEILQRFGATNIRWERDFKNIRLTIIFDIEPEDVTVMKLRGGLEELMQINESNDSVLADILRVYRI